MTWPRPTSTTSLRRQLRRPRAGISSVELTVAVLLLASVFAALGPMLTWIRQQRRRAEDRQLALLELSNAAERLSLRDYDDLTADQLGQLQFPPSAAAELPGGELTATVDDESAPVGKRVTLRLSWSEDGVRQSAPLQLVLWRYPREEAAP